MVYIPNLKQKKEAWDNPHRVREASPETRRMIESTQMFKELQREKDQQVQVAMNNLQQKKEDAAARTQWRSKTKEEKSRMAIEKLTDDIKLHGEMKINKVKSADEARRMAVGIAEKAEKVKGEK